MPPTEYGSGPSLSPSLDIEIDPTGDVNTADGVDELEKDLSFRIINALESQPIGVMDANTKEEIHQRVERSVSADDRIDRIIDITVVETESIDRVGVGVTVDTGDDVVTASETR